MSIEMKWRVQNRILDVIFRDTLTIDDLNQAHTQFLIFTENQPDKLLLVLNLTNLQNFPLKFTQYDEPLQRLRQNRRNFSVIVIGAKPVARLLSNLITALLSIESWMVDTPEQADEVMARLCTE